MSGTTRQDEPAFDRGRTVPPTVFISYASNDAAVAEQICRLLEDDAIGCWIAPRNVDPGHDFAEQILDGIESTRVMVLLLSAHANASPFVKAYATDCTSLAVSGDESSREAVIRWRFRYAF
jgi:hypothetical protein